MSSCRWVSGLFVVVALHVCAAVAVGSTPWDASGLDLEKAIESGDVSVFRRALELPPGQVRWHALMYLPLAAERGHVDLVQLLLDNGADPNQHAGSPGTALGCAAEAGHLATVRALLTHGAQLDARDWSGRTPLHRAAIGGHRPVAAVLLAQGASVGVQDEEGWNPLHYAVWHGHTELAGDLMRRQTPEDLFSAAGLGHITKVRSLLAAEPRLGNASGPSGTTALHWAARRNQVEVLGFLVAHGIPADRRDSSGRTALHVAAEAGAEEACSALLEAGAEASAEDRWGRTPLHWAAGSRSEGIVSLLLKRGVDVQARDAVDGSRALDYAAANGDIPLARLLIAAGADVNSAASEAAQPGPTARDSLAAFLREKGIRASVAPRLTPLERAAKGNHSEMVVLLISRGAQVNAREGQGGSALHIAAEAGASEAVRVLLEHGAQINGRDASGRTALHYAANAGHAGTVRALVAAGADVNARAEDGLSPLRVAAQEGHADIAKMLVAAGAQHDAFSAGALGDVQALEALLQAQPGLAAAANGQGRTPLFYAVVAGRLQAAARLLAAGADPNSRGVEGQRLLHTAAMLGRTDMVRLLLAHGAEVDLADEGGLTPLFYAGWYGQMDAARALLDAGADIYTGFGGSLLHRWVEAGNTEGVKLLLQRGVDLTVKDHLGRTPLELALQLGRADIAQLLRGQAVPE